MYNEPKKTVSAPKPEATVTIGGEEYVILLKSEYEKLVSGSGDEGGEGDPHTGPTKPNP